MAKRNNTGDIFFAAVAGLALGTMTGVLVGEWVGDVNRERVRRGLKRLRRSQPLEPPIEDPKLLEQVVTQALRTAPDIYLTGVKVEPVGPGIVELIGWTDDESEREHLGDVARRVPGVQTVVNRVLVHGVDDIPPEEETPDILD